MTPPSAIALSVTAPHYNSDKKKKAVGIAKLVLLLCQLERQIVRLLYYFVYLQSSRVIEFRLFLFFGSKTLR